MEPIQSGQSSPAANPNDPLAAQSPVVGCGDPGEEMAALAVESAKAQRTNAHIERDAEEAAEARANAAQVQAMHDEASSLRAQGVFDAATAVAGALIAVVCPPVAAGAGIGAAGAASTASAAAASAAMTRNLVAGHLSDGVEKLGDGLFKAAQHDDEASAAAARASAAQHADAVRNASDAAGEADATLAAALDFDRNYTSIEAQTQLAALHRA